MSRSFSRSSVLNANSFGSLCEAEDPIAWSVTDFYREVMSPMSRLEPLLYADVTKVICYHQRSGVGHDFLIMCIRPRIGQEHFGERIWARCERHPGPVQGGLVRLSTSLPPALDTITLSFDRPKLNKYESEVIMESAFRNLQVLHVADLLRIIRSVSPTYGVASHNSWWFAVIAIGTLRVFGKDWTIQPRGEWVRHAIRALRRDTVKSSEEVTRLFVQAWNAGGQSESIPLTSDQAWGDQRHGLVLHRQVQPPRAPTFPTPIPDTVESSEEVTRRFVPAWSPGGQSEFIPLTSDQAWRDQHHGLVPIQEVPGASDMESEYKEPRSRSSLPPVGLQDTLPEPLCSVVLESPFPVRRGGYGAVFKGSWKSRPIALKLLGPNDRPETAHKRFKGEIDIWRKLRHENVLPFFGHYVGDYGAMYMISPWCQQGDINNYLLMFPETDREMLVLQLLHGLEYLHQSGVIHGDLRGANILISNDHEVWIADFGLSKHLDQSPTSTVNRGNVRWMAPELLEQEIPRGDLTPYTEATDIYSFAMTTIEIYTGLPPFPHLRHDVAAACHAEGDQAVPVKTAFRTVSMTRCGILSRNVGWRSQLVVFRHAMLRKDLRRTERKNCLSPCRYQSTFFFFNMLMSILLGVSR
ncbi:hypothetical protein BS47DRAFT_1318665 [Hydnum rufescens UP504]|uniref:Protein kinase domain-containing protein n=1 Tax=Hydnum rufescens UP504 TaxID=1448309 RepID=A0A9P6ATZ5_9AGAM|nr:hypothetical protein BS47DRAFT_1318665 [Hydnum rufescens UP504]